MRYFRYGLPVAIGTGAHAGTWHALLTVDPRLWKRYLDALGNDKEALARAQALGARYSVSAYAWSNLRMRASLEQTSLEPSSTAHLRAVLTEYGLPVDGRATVRAEVSGPVAATVGLAWVGSGDGTRGTCRCLCPARTTCASSPRA